MERFRFVVPWITALALLSMFGLAVTSMAGDSPTFDEQGFLVRGLAYLRGEENGGKRDIRVGHPLGLNALNASLLINDPTVQLPADDPSWKETSFHRPAELFLWEIGNNVEHIMFVARMPTVWLGLLLAAIGARWATEMAGGWRGRIGGRKWWPSLAGLLTLLLIGFDPNILAHTRLVTTDLGLAAAAGLAGYTLWRFARKPKWSQAFMAGTGLGLLLNTKFTALLFIPLFGLVILFGLAPLLRKGSSKERIRIMLMVLVVFPAIAFLILWAGHGFQIGPLPTSLPILGDLGGMHIPLADYLDQLSDISNRLEVTTPSFLLGRYSDSGWWYYFPIAFLLKTPLPTLLLLAWGIVYLVRSAVRREGLIEIVWFDLFALIVPAAGYFGIALTTDINLGYRHLLPILPFLYVFIAVVVAKAVSDSSVQNTNVVPRLAAALMAWLIIASFWLYPHYLAFFNLLGGGPNNGWRALVDSNLDWGQDLGRLATRLAESNIDRVWLSYFGEARPDYYDIVYDGLDSFAPRLMNPNARPYFPHDPAPGWYAISATTLQGVHFADHDQFAYFRNRTPVDKIGYSIFLYHQLAHGPAVDLLLSDLQVDELSAEEFALMGTNDVHLRWFDAEEGIVIPNGTRPVWMALGDSAIHPMLTSLLEPDSAAQITVGDGDRLFPVKFGRSPGGESTLALELGSGRISHAGAPRLEVDGDTLRVITLWRQIGEIQPVKIFVHVLDSSGMIVAQWDGIATAWEGWRGGDTLIQLHEISIEGLSPGKYKVVSGLYNPDSMQRWQTARGMDIIELGEVEVP